MKVSPRNLRIDPPRLHASDHVIEQLSALAAAGTGGPARRRGAIVASVAAGVLALGMGGAWASGTIEVPGLPKPGHTAPVDPSPTDDTPAMDDAPESPRPSEEDSHDGGPSEGRDGQRPGPTTDDEPGKGAGAERDPGARGQAEERRPDHTATPDSRGRSDDGGKPESPGRSDETGKPDETGKSGDVGNAPAPRGSGAEKPAKPRTEPSTRTAERRSTATGGEEHVKDERDG